ncbi:hypothetical protein [Actinoplanes sp. N902-109]|uniref:hypothetical protein n=1 Tax=Actinoplanes sp. (strain N902-109) TaxID=649831 RepID=UPI0003293770|nr:hypothetical protein [Actinoplanes sp. N902-109]AGL16932.1 extracellular repeat protein, HAF family [Actinoplanes sp. N902-109]
MFARTLAVVAVTMVAVPMGATATATAATPVPAHGRLVALGSLGGGDAWADGMNQRGDLIGQSRNAEAEWQGAVWWHDRTQPVTLGVADAMPVAINDHGHIAARGAAPFLWRNGRITYLSRSTRSQLAVSDINEHDEISGTVTDAGGRSRAFQWRRGTITVLSTPKAMNSFGYALNNRGDVVGTLVDPRPGTSRAVLWQHGRMIRLAGPDSVPVALNDRTQIIGYVAGHPFLWHRGRLRDLLAGTGADYGRVTGINRAGDLSGLLSRPGTGWQPVLWRAGRPVVIGLPAGHGTAAGINDRGDVTGLLWPSVGAGESVPYQPFQWRQGRTTVFDPPSPNLGIHNVGIDNRGGIAINVETSGSGLALFRSADR